VTRTLLGLAVFLVLLVRAPSASAYPWMIRHGHAQCASCHEDPMGGETLSGFGRAMGDTLLPTQWGQADAPSAKGQLLFGLEEPRALRLGGSIRYMTALYQAPRDGADGKFTSFPMQGDVYGQLRVGPVRVGGSLGVARVPLGSPHAQAAQITSNTEGERPMNLLSRSHWIGYDVSDRVLVRAGRLNLPFGIRLPEHVLWVRDATRTDRESDQQHGVAVAYHEGKLRGEVMAIAGNYQLRPDDFRERGYSLSAEYVLDRNLAAGVSSLITHAKQDRVLLNGQANTRQVHGLTARWAPLAPLAVLAEADVLFSSASSAGYAGLLQLDYEVVSGLHGLVTGEALDSGKRDGVAALPGAGDPRLGAWLSVGWFFFTHFDVRADLVLRQEAPVTFQSQVHFYF
jgi:hypothetical protein